VIHVSGIGTKRELPAIIESEHAIGQRPIGDDIEPRLGTLDGPQIAAMLLDRVGQVQSGCWYVTRICFTVGISATRR
jgi:hypothetical protein